MAPLTFPPGELVGRFCSSAATGSFSRISCILSPPSFPPGSPPGDTFYPDDRADDSLRHQPHSMRPDEPISIDPDNQPQNNAWEKAQNP